MYVGETGDGFARAASARAEVVGDVTGGTLGAGTALAAAAPVAAAGESDATVLPDAATVPAEEPADAAPCTVIDDPESADTVVSSGDDVAKREQPAIGRAARPIRTNPAASLPSMGPPHVM
ncbi:MAG TPA: hypothetical protein VNE82_24780 [Candidatus Binataceae bacterium]|nr:hypothetical protein [Candidatus Binataceae bacterium]